MPARRYNCRCGKKRYRDERQALAAAAADQRAHHVAATVYRCPGGLAWHVTSRGCTPQALRSVGRRLAYELVAHGEVDLDEFRARVAGTDPRRRARVSRCARQMTDLALTRWAPAAAGIRLAATDRAGLARVVQIGLDGYAAERAR
ncbi:hypothetical protein [Actinoplanes teichomyceticus]|uniref:Uncharacterized protein n=1 Tax=Actinoplanes teichomyceticus TaxID=1867 RepID=A0A561VCN6_ACTTI|nr:hypothetical protein [Actinoplanes teichomyceticus]TWG09357.1 hypothetical protein FHX34_10872 [Actinoplanes teichomyceticus]GIF16619.1 hypothetical protein Ate01nite_66510 [Actinoplanes teichomyceticus]